jgi:hypothetical protein
LCNRSTQCIRVHVVREPTPPIDLHDRDPLPVRSLELVIAVDRDLPQLEAELVACSRDHPPSRLAEVTAGGGVEDDLGYG